MVLEWFEGKIKWDQIYINGELVENYILDLDIEGAKKLRDDLDDWIKREEARIKND
jgi:hypothetical protein